MEAMYDSTYFDPEIDGIYPARPAPLLRDIDRMAPGPVLGSYLAGVDVDRLSGYDRVVALRAIQRMQSYFDAMHVRAVGAISDVLSDPNGDEVEDLQATEAELRAALHFSRRAAEADITLSLGLRDRLPRVLEALERGEIDLRQARAFHTSTENLDEYTARSIVDEVLTESAELTAGEIRARVVKRALASDADSARERMKASHEDRRVVAEPNPSGTANLHIMDLLPHQAAAAKNRLIHLSRNARRSGEERSTCQIQADAALDLLLGSPSAGSQESEHRGSVTIKVDLTTLAELDDHPGELAGFGPVISDIARKVAEGQHDTPWTYAVTDPDSGIVVSSGMTRRRPTAALRRTVEAKLQTCVFPGCRIPATDCDIDHTKPWASNGPTEEGNLAPLCRHDHGIKSRAGWTYRVVDGRIMWTSPLGHTYRKVRPPP